MPGPDPADLLPVVDGATVVGEAVPARGAAEAGSLATALMDSYRQTGAADVFDALVKLVGGQLLARVRARLRGFAPWLASGVTLGIGTAMVYPTLLAAVGDVAHPAWRASAVGVYRLWRDLGYAVGAVLAGVLADSFGMGAAIAVGASFVIIAVPDSDAVRVYERAGFRTIERTASAVRMPAE